MADLTEDSNSLMFQKVASFDEHVCNQSGVESKSKQRKFERVLGHCYQILSSHIGLVALLVAYSFIGAAVFQAIEAPHEQQANDTVNVKRQTFIESTWNIFQQQNGSNFRNWTNIVLKELELYDDELMQAYYCSVGSKAPVWNFWNALVYAGTIYTTIGYGGVTPVTTEGKIATMFYAVIGVPLCLIVLADLGKLNTRAFKFLWSVIRRCYYTGSCKIVTSSASATAKDGLREKSHTCESNKNENTRLTNVTETYNHRYETVITPDKNDGYKEDKDLKLPVWVAIFVTLVYIFIGAGMYKIWETNWEYLDAFYFIFISISTIGFGDIVPVHTKYFLLSSVYVFVGLALVSMCVNVMVGAFSSSLTKAGHKVTKTFSNNFHLNMEVSDSKLKKLSSKEGKGFKCSRRRSF